ncbi:ABC transporter substrate-binding protein [Paenibacillus sp. P25]|nr:ABC transporter substrate-binding protein [Paenibacillus sp. P25]
MVNRTLRMLLSGTMALSVIGLTACNAGSGSPGGTAETPVAGKKVTLSLWNGFTGPDGELLKSIVDGYNKKNSDKVEIKMDIMPWDQLNQKSPPSIATKTAPSFVMTIGGFATPYIQNGSFQDMSDFFSVTGADKADFTSASLQMGQKDGKQYLLPMQMNGLYLYWNKDLFKAAGLDPEKPPETMEQLAEYAVKLTDPGKNQFGLGSPVKGAPEYFASFLMGNGGDIVDLQAKKSLLHSSANLKTFTWLQDLVVNKKVSPKGATGADTDKLMQSGKLAMYINGPWLAPGLKSNNISFGIALPPKGDAARYTSFGGIGFAIPSSTPADQKKAVYDFIKYWNSTEIGKEWSLKNGFPPYLNSVINDPQVKADPLVSAMANMGDAAQPYLPNLTSAGKITNDILFPAIEALENGQPAAEVTAKASAQIDDALKAEK